MSYSTLFDPKRYTGLEAHLGALQGLPEGQVYELSFKSPKTLQRARLLIYDWLHHMGLKESFRIRTLAGRTLLIERLGRLTGLTGRTLQQGVSPLLDKAIKEALVEVNPREALERAAQRGQINQDELAEGLEILQRVLGKEA